MLGIKFTPPTSESLPNSLIIPSQTAGGGVATFIATDPVSTSTVAAASNRMDWMSAAPQSSRAPDIAVVDSRPVAESALPLYTGAPGLFISGKGIVAGGHIMTPLPSPPLSLDGCGGVVEPAWQRRMRAVAPSVVVAAASAGTCVGAGASVGAGAGANASASASAGAIATATAVSAIGSTTAATYNVYTLPPRASLSQSAFHIQPPLRPTDLQPVSTSFSTSPLQLEPLAPPGPAPDANKLHAASLRARMLGRTIDADALLLRAHEATAAATATCVAATAQVIAAAAASAHVILPVAPASTLTGSKRPRAPDNESPSAPMVVSFDNRGAPLLFAQLPPRVASKPNLISSDGGRSAFFPEDIIYGSKIAPNAPISGRIALTAAGDKSRKDLSALRAQEWLVGTGDADAALARGIVRAGGLRLGGDGSGRGEADSAFDDDAAALLRGGRGGGVKINNVGALARERARAIGTVLVADRATADCLLCLDGGRGMTTLQILSLGDYSFIALPTCGSLFAGHVVIAPRAHVATLRGADEAAFAEVNRFRAALHAAWSAIGMEPVFLETALCTGSGARSHAIVHAVPLPLTIAQDAPLIFRQAFADVEEWTTHKAIIDTAGKGLRKSIPDGFSYVHVSWAGGGLVHPIERDDRWKKDWALDVVAGMLGRGSARQGASQVRRTPAQLAMDAAQFKIFFKNYDFSQPETAWIAERGGGP